MKQPLLKRVLVEMLFVPIALLFIVIELGRANSNVFLWVQEQSGATPLSIHALLFLVNVALSLWILWGFACVLVVGRRIIKNPAGRSRSSVSIVRKEARKYVFSLFLTDILRDCGTVLWSILLVVPGIVYRTRTAFFAVVTICEGKEYRDALHGSSATVRGSTLGVLWRLIGLYLMLVIPAWIMTFFIFRIAQAYIEQAVFVAALLSAVPLSIAALFYQLSTVHLYKALKS